MEQMTVVGIRRGVEFKTKDGQEIRGTSLYITQPNDKVVGVFADKLFLSDKVFIPDDVVPGSEVLVSYNRYGKVAEVVMA